jgi:BlaI family transcriptional regulator, penicillinase repressor
MNSKPPTDAELEVLQVLWTDSPQSVRHVNEKLNEKRQSDDKEIGYTTTLKTMQLMLDKGLLSRDASERTHLYAPALPQETTQTLVLNDVMDMAFGGSAGSLVLRALGSNQTSKEELQKIKELIGELERKIDS